MRNRSEVSGPTNVTSIAALCVALNVALGTIVYLIKLPIYLDAVGTIATALLVGPTHSKGCLLSSVVGAVSFVLSGMLFNPVLFWFIPTQIAIAAFSYYVIRPLLRGYFIDGLFTPGRVGLVLVLGVGLGIVAAVVSAPFIAYQFGGITGSGASLVVALLLKSGSTLLQSVLVSGLTSEPVDKTFQLMMALALVKATPPRIRRAVA
jgi:energy-coupling factor transport system substrate-specific component